MSDTLLFTIFCLENYKAEKGLTGKEVDALFRQYEVYDYLHEFYDVLHTTSRQYIMSDIDRYISVRMTAT